MVSACADVVHGRAAGYQPVVVRSSASAGDVYVVTERVSSAAR